MLRMLQAGFLGALAGVLVGCQRTPETKTAQPEGTTPTKSGYADVHGIKLYHEIYGSGAPLVLIHGGLTTIGEMRR